MSEDYGSSAARIPTEQTAWVVLGSSGQWSDWSQWPVEVHLDEQAAKDAVVSREAAIREVMAVEPSDAYTDDDEHTPEYKAWLERLRTVDPQADQYDQPHYTAREVPLVAPTTAAGAVGTSAASEQT